MGIVSMEEEHTIKPRVCHGVWDKDKTTGFMRVDAKKWLGVVLAVKQMITSNQSFIENVTTKLNNRK